ncbi:MAG: hypothetical protein GYB31_19570 [Bacteroidetes bacterium]|nr:hypothetical protein [Bacteroidota bacterium]
MAESTPRIRTISWPAVIMQVLLLALLIKILSWLGLANPFPFVFGPLFFLMFSYGMRYWLAGNHMQGMRAVRNQNFHAALEHFEASVKFFDKNPKADKYRALTMLSASRFCYREMGLINMAYCYGQMGRGEDMVKLYQEVAREYPENEIARTALKMIEREGEE